MSQGLKRIWSYFSNLGIYPNLPELDIRITRLMNQFAFTIAAIVLVSFCYQCIFHLAKEGRILPNTYLMFVTYMPLILVFWLNHKRKYTTAKLFFIIQPILNILLWIGISGIGEANLHYSLLIFPIPIVVLFRKLRTQIILIIIVYLSFVIAYFMPHYFSAILVNYENTPFVFISFFIWLACSFLMLRFFLAELGSAREKLLAKNNELEEFTRAAAHDMKEPLRTMGSFATLLRKREGSALSQDGLDHLEYIHSGAQRLTHLLENLTRYSMVQDRVEPMEMIDLNQVCEEVLEGLKLLIGESETRIIVGKLPSVMAHRSNMVQVFQNLLHNGIKFQPNKEGHVPQIGISSKRVNAYHEISIKDNGIGIDVKNLDHVFGKFNRVHNQDSYEGTGLGLATVRKIVNIHKGKITAKSEIGKGTEMVLSLMAV